MQRFSAPVLVACLLFVSLALAACTGADGPMGPAGPQGLPGPAGPQGLPGPAGTNGSGTRVNYVVAINALGTAGVALPAEAGTNPNAPPSVACYTSSFGTTWFSVSDSGNSTGAPYCVLGFIDGAWAVAIIDGQPGWWAAFAVVY